MSSGLASSSSAMPRGNRSNNSSRADGCRCFLMDRLAERPARRGRVEGPEENEDNRMIWSRLCASVYHMPLAPATQGPSDRRELLVRYQSFSLWHLVP